MRKLTVLALGMLCSAVSACGPERVQPASALRPDLTNPERFDCQRAGTRPTVAPEYQIDWSKISTVGQARTEFENFKLTLRGRENIVAGYLLGLEAINFNCWSDTQWQLEFYRGLPDQPQP